MINKLGWLAKNQRSVQFHQFVVTTDQQLTNGVDVSSVIVGAGVRLRNT